MEWDYVHIFCKAPHWKPWFLLKIKIWKNPGRVNEEHNGIFKHIHQDIRAYSRSKNKSVLVNDWEDIAY